MRVLHWGLAVALCVAVPAIWAEDPPKDQSEQQADQQPTPAAPAGSLAAAASKIKLQQPEGEGSGSLVITDQNVKSAGQGAAVSQGSGVATGAPPPAALTSGQRPAATDANAVADELQAQRVKVQNMEAQLADYDRQLAEPSTDPHYPKYSDAPQFRSPGVVDPAKGKRDELARRLEEERGKLVELEKKAGQAGVKQADPVPSAK
jgi:hypothetical protein